VVDLIIINTHRAFFNVKLFMKERERIMKRILISGLMLVLAAGCATAPKQAKSQVNLNNEVNTAIVQFKSQDPTIQRFFDDSYGYAILPKVFKGGFWVGGAHGNGQIYKGGQMVGFCSMSQANIGFTFGGQSFSEAIFFANQSAFEKFQAGHYAMSTHVTATAINRGVAANETYKNGVAVFVTDNKGLMVDASVGGQKFKCVPYKLDYARME
jgi:lipid-binding SYLF domain-containing protein